jgi:hypothetical protein
MTLVLIFQDGNGAATGSGTAQAASTFTPAVHRKVGVRQAGVPSHGGGSGLAMRGWLRGWRESLTTPHSAPQ